MSFQRTSAMAAMTLMAGLAGSAFALSPLRILTPAPDSVVREQVPIKIPSAAVPNTVPTPGYVVVNIDGKFQAAVSRPKRGSAVTYLWNTKASTDRNVPEVPDGKHEIRVTAVTQDGKQIGNTDRVEVFVQNSVRSAPSQARLSYKFVPGTQHTYVKKTSIKQADAEVYKARLVLLRIADDLTPDGKALLRERIDRDSVQSDQGQVVPLTNAGQSISFNVTSNGMIFPGLRMLLTGQKLAMNLPLFPTKSIKTGETWMAPVQLSPMYQGIDSLTLPAESTKHTLQDFEWQDGVPTARIDSTFDGTVTVVSEGVPTLYKVTGKRTTYFDYRAGRIVKMIDDYSIASSEATGTINITSNNGTVSSGPPGYAGGSGPYMRGGPGGGGGGAADVGKLSINSITQLTG